MKYKSKDGRIICDEAHLETLCIPVLDFAYGRHVTQVVRKLVEFFDTVSEANW
jgi:hypothetical protein